MLRRLWQNVTLSDDGLTQLYTDVSEALRLRDNASRPDLWSLAIGVFTAYVAVTVLWLGRWGNMRYCTDVLTAIGCVVWQLRRRRRRDRYDTEAVAAVATAQLGGGHHANGGVRVAAPRQLPQRVCVHAVRSASTGAPPPLHHHHRHPVLYSQRAVFLVSGVSCKA